MASSAMKMMKDIQKMNSDLQIKLQEMTNTSTAQSFEYNAQEAEKARNWQTQMSNTSHQREVADLKAAGLNPVLSSGGSGAAGYTTSAASASADNPANAVASAFGSSIGAMSSIKAAQISSAANLKAAQASAAAVRDAAYAQASAQKYASDKAYESTKYATDHQKVNNVWQAVDKILDKLGFSDTVSGSNLISNANKGLELIVNRPQDIIKTVKDMSHIVLNTKGVQIVKDVLHKLNIPYSLTNQSILVGSFVYHNRGSIKQLANLMRTYYKQAYTK